MTPAEREPLLWLVGALVLWLLGAPYAAGLWLLIAGERLGRARCRPALEED